MWSKKAKILSTWLKNASVGSRIIDHSIALHSDFIFWLVQDLQKIFLFIDNLIFFERKGNLTKVGNPKGGKFPSNMLYFSN